ncbi:hypothetical protein C8035_v008974 [Colletotrichum spinosum]|uniref:Uncharacterized protein n=1 Tax=Colletotrichum spinosum TaxID=1347390 RepID=A0A4R8QED9_9PEZI|nr:hypothetical protein C8035_v008974 [Colletotrichum spinosum]
MAQERERACNLATRVQLERSGDASTAARRRPRVHETALGMLATSTWSLTPA